MAGGLASGEVETFPEPINSPLPRRLHRSTCCCGPSYALYLPESYAHRMSPSPARRTACSFPTIHSGALPSLTCASA